MPGILEQIADLEAEYARTQKNKATEYHLGRLKAKLAKLKSEVMAGSTKSGGKAGDGFDVTKSGDTRVGLIGFPSVGKSTLLTTLTGTESLIAAYEFTTRALGSAARRKAALANLSLFFSPHLTLPPPLCSSDGHPRHAQLQGRAHPDCGPAWYHRGRQGRQGPRAAGDWHGAHVRAHPDRARREQARDAEEDHGARARGLWHPPQQEAAEPHLHAQGQGRPDVPQRGGLQAGRGGRAWPAGPPARALFDCLTPARRRLPPPRCPR